MAEVPEHKRSRIVRGACDRADVLDCAGQVRDVRKGDEGHVQSQCRLYRLHADAAAWPRIEQPKLQSPAGSQALEDVPVGWEAVAAGQDHAATGPGVQRRGRQLVQVDRGGVADRDLPGSRPQQLLAQVVADTLTDVDPVVPGPHEPAPPACAHRLVDGCDCGFREPAQRVAVQVDQVRVVYYEVVTEPAGRVLGVQALGFGALHGVINWSARLLSGRA